MPAVQLLLVEPFAPLASRAGALFDVAHVLMTDLAQIRGISRQRLTGVMADRFGATDASGAWTMRDAYDALELAQVLMLMDGQVLPLTDPQAMLAQLESEARRLPTQTYRSERQVGLQQFSTPAPLAWLAAVV